MQYQGCFGALQRDDGIQPAEASQSNNSAARPSRARPVLNPGTRCPVSSADTILPCDFKTGQEGTSPKRVKKKEKGI